MGKLRAADPVTEFASLVQQGVDAWVRAGKILAEESAGDRTFLPRLRARCPWLDDKTTGAFLRMGRRELVPQLVLLDCPGAAALSQMPYAAQVEYCSAPVRVLRPSGPARASESRPVKLSRMTTPEAALAFDTTTGHVRTPEEQAEVLRLSRVSLHQARTAAAEKRGSRAPKERTKFTCGAEAVDTAPTAPTTKPPSPKALLDTAIAALVEYRTATRTDPEEITAALKLISRLRLDPPPSKG